MSQSPTPNPTQRDARAPRECDGVVCFGGEDWWYHNRGHFDMQMMRELSAHTPVLYVNSIGMRVPRLGEGAMFFKRVRRKLKSLARGLVRVRDGFAVLSPVSIPGRLGGAASKWLMAQQVRSAARSMGIRSPLVWVACPPAADVLDALHPGAVVYQRTDRFEAFTGVDKSRITGCDRRLKSRADLTLFCSRSLHEEEGASCRESMFVDHGVDFEMFRRAGLGRDEPAEFATIDRPRVGFVGGIDAHTFDPDLFVEVARLTPEATFVLVGGCSLPAGWCTVPNVRMLGQVPYDQVAGYMAANDVLIMPWNRSEWIKACNPVKLKEYLGTGRPVVSTPFDELRNYEGLVRVGTDAATFAAHVRDALREPGDPRPGQARVERETWAAKGRLVRDRLEDLGVRLVKRAAAGR